jgi:CIC family chloride channel protein
VIDSVQERFGRIRKRVAIIKTLASSITIGSGGSAGREGPIAQIGAGIASTLGQLMRLKASELRVMVSAGLVAGISGTFNAPLGALIFGIEILSPTLEASHLISLVLASVSGKIVATIFLGDFPAFRVPPNIGLSSIMELQFVVILALVIGLIASLWVKAFYWMEDLFEKFMIPEPLKPMLGGILVGLLALNWPNLGVLGVGYDVVERYLTTKGFISIDLFISGFLKMIATIYTIGSGGSGGIFAPSLVIGSTLGGAFGEILSTLFSGIVGDPRAYSIIGMAIFFTAVAKAPLTTLIMIPEMTRSYSLFLPIMVGNSIGYIVSLLILGRESIYTLKVRKIKRRAV